MFTPMMVKAANAVAKAIIIMTVFVRVFIFFT